MQLGLQCDVLNFYQLFFFFFFRHGPFNPVQRYLLELCCVELRKCQDIVQKRGGESAILSFFGVAEGG